MNTPQEELLWHYTSWNAAQCIIKDRSIWASHMLFLNDTQELAGGLRIIRERLIELNQPEDVKAAGLRAIDEMQNQNFFVTSFSAAYDQLSQWRAYCNDHPGVALGFSKDGLHKSCSQQNVDGSPKYLLKQCHYDTQLTERLAVRSVNYWANRGTLRMGTLPPEQTLQLRAKYFMENMWGNIANLKNSSFSEENESRIITHKSIDESNLWKFHQSKSMIVPHISIELEQKDQNIQFPLKEILIGPNPHMALAKRAVEMFLKQEQLSVEVKESGIPYRNW